MALHTFTSGVDTSFTSELNTSLSTAYPKVSASTPYTGSGFDATYSSATTAGSTTNTVTLTVAAGVIQDYVRLVMLYYYLCSRSGGGGNSYGYVHLKVETAVASSGSWTTQFDSDLQQCLENNSIGAQQTGRTTFEFYYAPTSSEKSSGLDIRISGTGGLSSSGGGGTGTINNIQTMIYAN